MRHHRNRFSAKAYHLLRLVVRRAAVFQDISAIFVTKTTAAEADVQDEAEASCASKIVEGTLSREGWV